MEHADKILQFFDADRLRRELGLELFSDFFEARLPVEHLQNGEFLFLEPKVLQPNGVFHDPIDATLVTLLARLEIGPYTDRQLPRRTGNNAVSESGHGGIALFGVVCQDGHA